MDAHKDRTWDEVAADWLGARPHLLWRRHHDAVAGRLIEQWLPSSCRSVLKTDLFDEAVGIGQMSILSSPERRVHGIDVTPVAVEAAGRRYAALYGIVADVRRLPYGPGSFDAVISLSTLDHFTDRTDIAVSLREFRRVLVPGGRLILTLDNPMNPLVALRQALPNRWLNRSGIVPYYCGPTLSPRALARAARDAGFAVLSETATIHCPRVLAVAIAGWIERHGQAPAQRRFLSTAMRFEVLGRWPTRWLSGHFSAVIAEAAALSLARDG